MKKILRMMLVIVLVAIAIVAVSYTVVKDSETKKNNENESSVQVEEKDKNKEQDKEETNKKDDEKNKVDNDSKEKEQEDFSNYKSNIEELVESEDNKKVLGDLKSGENTLVYKESSGNYYEYCFENDKITDIYYYVECGNSEVAKYMLEAYTTDEIKELYSEAEIYKENAIKAKLSNDLVKTYSNYTRETLMKKMEEAGNELR